MGLVEAAEDKISNNRNHQLPLPGHSDVQDLNIKKNESYKVKNFDSGIENASCVNNLIAWVNVTWSLIKYHLDIIDAKCS